MGIELRLLDWAGNELKVLPDVEGLTLSPVLCDAGAIEFSYPRDGANWEHIRDLDEFPVAVYLDGVKEGTLQGLVKEVDGDDVDETAVWKFTGFFNNGRMAEAVTYPAGWPTVDRENPKLKFLSISAGTLVATLMSQAQARGTLAGMTYNSFSATHDSNGVAWPSLLSIEYAPGVDYLTILGNLYEQRLCEFQVVGNDLRLYVIDSLAVDRTLGANPVVFRAGRDLNDSPRKRSTRKLGTVMLAAGTEGLYVERKDLPQIAARRRIEASAGQGQVSDAGTLALFGDAELSRISTAKMEKTHGLTFGDEPTPRPIRHFNVGDWVFSDVGKGLERLRVKQWTLALDSDGELSGSVVLNDLFAEQNEQLTKRIQGIVGGSTITGGSAAEREIPVDYVDGVAPQAPTGLTLTSKAYVEQGKTFANVEASWNQVTANSDGTVLDDLERYEVRWRYQLDAPLPEPWRYVNGTTDTRTSWSPVGAGQPLEAQIRAVDRANNASDWMPVVPIAIMSASDTTPPEAPSAPVMDTYLGLIRARWNGKMASGANPPPDFNVLEVHSSLTANFTPDATTLVDTLSGAGRTFLRGNYSSTAPSYAKFIAVDHSGNKSAPSAEANGIGNQVVSGDIFDGAVGTAKLADLAVTTAKINDLAVNTAKVGELSAAKISAGIMSADVTVSGRFATALTGARVEMNSLGFQKFGAANELMVSITGSDALLTGRYKSALDGRRIEMGASGGTGRIEFYAPNGTVTEVGGFTGANVAIETIRIGVRDPLKSQFWEKIQIQDDGKINHWADHMEFTVGGRTDAPGFQVSWAGRQGTGPDDNDLEAYERFRIDFDELVYYSRHKKTQMWLSGDGSNRFYADADSSCPGNVLAQWTDANRTATWDRAWYHSNGNTYHSHSRGAGTFWRDRSSGGTLVTRMALTDNDWYFRYSNDDRIIFSPPYGPDASPSCGLIKETNFGTKLIHVSADNGSSQRLEVRDAGISIFDPVWAGSFIQQSSGAVKSKPRAVAKGARKKIRSLEVVTYQRRNPKPAELTRENTERGIHTARREFADRVETGVIAESAATSVPEVIVEGGMVDLGSTVFLSIAAQQESDDLLDDLLRRVIALEKKGK